MNAIKKGRAGVFACCGGAEDSENSENSESSQPQEH